MPTSVRWAITNLPKIFVKKTCILRADRVVRPYEIRGIENQRRRGRRLCRPKNVTNSPKSSVKTGASCRAEQSPAPTKAVRMLGCSEICRVRIPSGATRQRPYPFWPLEPKRSLLGRSRASASWAGTYQAYSVSHPAVSSPPAPSAYRRRSVSPFGRQAAACAAGRSGAGVDVAV